MVRLRDGLPRRPPSKSLPRNWHHVGSQQQQMGPKNAPRGGPRVKKDKKAANLYRIGGVDLPYDPELTLDTSGPTPLFPEYKPGIPEPLTDKEKGQVDAFKAFRKKVHDGPLYTILGENVRVTKPGQRPPKPAATFDAFDGMPKYSARYTKPKRMIPKLDTRPFVLDFFPKELHSTIDPTATTTASGNSIPSNSQRKSLFIPGHLGATTTEDADPEATNSGEEGEEKAARDPEDENPLEGEEVDDNFEDEDEEGGDYNAEQYFDDGGEEGGEDYDAGGEDKGGGWID